MARPVPDSERAGVVHHAPRANAVHGEPESEPELSATIPEYVMWGMALLRCQAALARCGYPIDGPPDTICTLVRQWAEAGLLPHPAAPPASEVTDAG